MNGLGACMARSPLLRSRNLIRMRLTMIEG